MLIATTVKYNDFVYALALKHWRAQGRLATDPAETEEGKIGLSFGVEYYLEGFNTKSKLEDVHFISKIIHPLLTNPVNKENTTETLEQKYDYLNQINYDYFSFEYDWEIKPGLWIFQVIEANTILFEKVFNII